MQLEMHWCPCEHEHRYLPALARRGHGLFRVQPHHVSKFCRSSSWDCSSCHRSSCACRSEVATSSRAWHSTHPDQINQALAGEDRHHIVPDTVEQGSAEHAAHLNFRHVLEQPSTYQGPAAGAHASRTLAMAFKRCGSIRILWSS